MDKTIKRAASLLLVVAGVASFATHVMAEPAAAGTAKASVLSETKWSDSASVLVSLIALLFSFGTTATSYFRTRSQDIQSMRVELRGLLQRLAELPRENVEAMKKYAGDPFTASSLGSSLNQENTLLARQAQQLAAKLPPGSVSATEYYSIALALHNAYVVDAAKILYTKAIETAIDMNDVVGSYRQRGGLLMQTGEPESARVDFQKALDVFRDKNYEKMYGDNTKRYTHIGTYIAWAMAEAGAGNRALANQKLDEAAAILPTNLPAAAIEPLTNQIAQARSVIGGDVALPKPVDPTLSSWKVHPTTFPVK